MFSMLWVLPAPCKYWCIQSAAIMQAPNMLPAPNKYWCAQPLFLGTKNAATLWQLLVHPATIIVYQ